METDIDDSHFFYRVDWVHVCAGAATINGAEAVILVCVSFWRQLRNNTHVVVTRSTG